MPIPAPRARGRSVTSITDHFLVTDQVAIVTGAGRGIGAATAVTLASAGADVVVSSRTADELDAVAGTGPRRGSSVRHRSGRPQRSRHAPAARGERRRRIGRRRHRRQQRRRLVSPTAVRHLRRFAGAGVPLQRDHGLRAVEGGHPRNVGTGRWIDRQHQLSDRTVVGPGVRRLRHGEGRSDPHDPT